MTQETNRDSFVAWQEVPEGVAEPAILVTPYNDVFELQQLRNTILINYESIPDLIKLLRQIYKDR